MGAGLIQRDASEALDRRRTPLPQVPLILSVWELVLPIETAKARTLALTPCPSSRRRVPWLALQLTRRLLLLLLLLRHLLLLLLLLLPQR